MGIWSSPLEQDPAGLPAVQLATGGIDKQIWRCKKPCTGDAWVKIDGFLMQCDAIALILSLGRNLASSD